MSSIVKNKALRTMKVFLTLFFAVLMIMPVFSPVSKVEASIESDLANKRNELKKLEGLLADAREEKSKILESLRETEGKLNSYLVEKSRLETSIGYSEKEIELINSLVEGYSQQIEELDENLKKVEKLKNEKISQLCLVLKYI
jgi:septal ring factor EnvC (AmiA/AmiB activator)